MSFPARAIAVVILAAVGCDGPAPPATAPSTVPATEPAVPPVTHSWPTPFDPKWPYIPRGDFETVNGRWKNGAKFGFAKPGDGEAIRQIVLRHLTTGKKQSVEEIRWLSADEVMVSASWYTGEVGSAEYWYVLQRTSTGWTIVTRYLLAIS